MSNSVVDQALDILVAGQDFTALRRALFATVAGHYLESESSAAPQFDQENYKVFALNALLARLPTCSLASVTTIAKGKTGIKDAVPGPFPLVVTAEARGSSDHFDFEGPGVMIPMVSSTGHGDASLKRVHFQDGQYAVGSILAVVQPKDTQQLSARYLHAYLSTFKDELLVSRMVGTANVSLTVAKIGDVPVPLLPISAQRKVDELMALCDRMEAQQADAERAHAQLVQALLDSLTQARDATDFTANWQRLAEHFHTLFTTEPSIDALKQTLLQLAVMGKLVPQDPSDVPASELCKNIEAEKQCLVAAKKVKDTPRLESVSADEELFTAPPSWVWIRMGDICRPISSGSTPSSELFQYDGGIPFLKVYNIRNQEIDFDYKKQFVSAEHHAEKMKRSTLVPGDVVMNIVGPPLGKVAIIPDTFPEWNCNQAIVFFGLIAPVSPHYIYTFLKEGSFLKNIALIGTAGQDNISVTKSKNIAVPLPPLAEQHRIVAKVDELMALCDQLKHRLTQARQLNEQLACTLVEQAIA